MLVPIYATMRVLSLDLGQRIVEAYRRGEGSAAALARRFHVGHRTVQRLGTGGRGVASGLSM